MATRTSTELKVFLEGTLAQYNALTDKTGTVFFDKTRRAVYAEGVLITSDVVDVKMEGSKLMVKKVGESTYTEIADLSIPNVFVKFTENQGLTLAEQKFARANIGVKDAVNNLTSTDTIAPLSAAQGKVLNDNKVDKVTGKGLSTNDFTDALKQKLDSLENYDDTELENAINNLQEQLDTLVNADADAAIDTFNEIINFLKGVENTDTLEGILAGIQQRIATLEGKTYVNSLNGLTGNVKIECKEAFIDDTDDDGSGEVGFRPFEVAQTASAITLGIGREGALGILAMALQKAADTSLDGWVRFDNIDVHFTPTSGDSEAHVTLSSTPKVWQF